MNKGWKSIIYARRHTKMFSKLPSDIVCAISEFVSCADICSLAQVSTTINSDLTRVSKKRKNDYLHRPPTITLELGTGIFTTMYDIVPQYQWHDDYGQYHRVNGPAVIWSNGDEEYYCHGKRHRVDGPAVILYFDDEDENYNEVRIKGDMFWFQHDVIYREKGPSIVLVADTDGTRQFYIDKYCGGSLSNWKKTNKHKIKDMMYECKFCDI
jgi:hypothetical protein